VARSSGLRVRDNHKVTAADCNKQGDVHAMEIGILGYDDLVWDLSFYVIGLAAASGLVRSNSIIGLGAGEVVGGVNPSLS